MPVIIIEHADDAVPLAEALLAGGIRTAEITLRTPSALAAIEQIASGCPDMLVGGRHNHLSRTGTTGQRCRRSLRRQPRLYRGADRWL